MHPLVTAEWLLEHLQDPEVRIADVRFSLADPLAGRMAYLEAHIPGAVYLDLETDLSGPVPPDRKGGRHPLPDPQALAATLGEDGIGDEHFVVAYDENGMFAPRLWWLLRWLGHERVAVLDGGIRAFVAAGGALTAERPEYPGATFTPRPQEGWVVSAEEVASRGPGTVLIDARAPERYRGEVEPIDPVAGHIPGAINRNWADNFEPDGRHKPPQALRERFAAGEGKELILYCGSGVSASANLLALEVAGIKGARLYAGSWSDWVSDPSRPVAKGEEG